VSSAVMDTRRPRVSGTPRSSFARARACSFHSSSSASVLYSGPRATAEIVLEFHTFDATYVGNLCAGDRQTEEHFVRYFSALLQVKLRSRLQSPHAIEDVRQETFARVFRTLRKENGLRQPECLGAFVNTVCNNVLLEHYRASRRVESLDEEGYPEPAVQGVSALDLVARGQMKAKVREILLDLSVRDRALLKAVFLDERDRDEVCREFGVDREYLRVLLHRAKQVFKEEFLKRLGPQAMLGANQVKA
jgi:RNA polymerase sigma-70 factor, ECF subfamily